MKVALIGCAKMKQRGIHPASELYVSPRFRTALTYARLACQEIFIISAKHGLLGLDTRISHYDLSLAHMKPFARRRWGAGVARRIFEVIPAGSELVFLAGKQYVLPLIEPLRGTYLISTPLSGLSTGGRWQWFKKELKALS